MPQSYEETVDKLVPLFDEINKITSQIQAEMAISLLQDPKMRKDLQAKSKLSGNQMIEYMNKGINAFIGVLPLAMQNNSNLFLTVMGHHSELTGNPLFRDVIDKIHDKNFERQYGHNPTDHE